MCLKRVVYSEDSRDECLVQSEPGYYITGLMNINEIGQYGLDLGGSVLDDLG